MKNTTVTLVKAYPNEDETCFVYWYRENNAAEEYFESDPERRWKAEVSLVDDTLTIIIPLDERHSYDDENDCSWRTIAKKHVERDGAVWFKGTDYNASGSAVSKVNVFVLADYKAIQ